MTKEEYRAIYAYDIDNFNSKLNEMVEEGWYPVLESFQASSDEKGDLFAIIMTL